MRLIDAEKFEVFSCVIPKKYRKNNETIAAYSCGMGKVLEAIDSAPTVHPESLFPAVKWISVKDWLPEVFDEVIVYDTIGGNYISIAWRETKPRKNGIVDWYWNSQMAYPEDLAHVTHWMPLPKPPEVTP